MTTRQSFFEATTNDNIWNKIINWNGYKLATVRWHDNREWKIVDTDSWETVKSYDYKPVAQFHTQQELWEYIKNE